MKALTVRQPWASLIAAGVKTIETRSWSTRYRGPLAIHAGMATADFAENLRLWAALGEAWDRPSIGAFNHVETHALGAVVATCTLADVVPIVDAPGMAGHPRVRISGRPGGGAHVLRPPDGSAANVTDQLPLGDFTPGRYAFLLTDIKPTTERCPGCWGGSAAPIGGCPLCGGPKRRDRTICEPVPAKGRRGLWDWEDA